MYTPAYTKANTADTPVNPLPGVPDVESPFFKPIFDQKSDPYGWRPIAERLHHDGFSVIDFPDDRLDAAIEEIKVALHDRYRWDIWNARKRMPVGGMRVQDAWQDVAAVKRIAVNQTMMDILAYCYGRRAIPFQTLNFAVGSQQHYHSDAVHFSSIPERFMVGVWVALEDIDAENGPLIYYPGSHKLPCLGNEHVGHDVTGRAGQQQQFHDAWAALVDEMGLKEREFHAKKGQALIWSANLLHGGQKQKDRKRTRWSQVTHYYFDDCFYYCPMGSDLAYGRADLRRPHDIRTGQPVPPRYLGRDINPAFLSLLQDNHRRGLEGDAPLISSQRGISDAGGAAAAASGTETAEKPSFFKRWLG